MADDKITITRALVEIKLLDKRIKKAVTNCTALKVRTANDKWDRQEFQTEASSNLQSIQDLIKRRNDIKARIIMSNAITKVRIGDTEYTIAEVIDKKQSIRHEKDLLDHLREQQRSAQETVERYNSVNRTKLDTLIELNFSKDRKNNDSDMASITKAFNDNNKVELVDPANVKKLIQDLDAQIMEFEKEADLVLSEINAVTYV